MASCFFLLRQFEDVLIYLKSIKQYLATDDDFNWNYGIACASNGEWAEAEEAFGAVQGVGYRQEGAFLNWSARTFIKQGKRKKKRHVCMGWGGGGGRHDRGGVRNLACGPVFVDPEPVCLCHEQRSAQAMISQLQQWQTMLVFCFEC